MNFPLPAASRVEHQANLASEDNAVGVWRRLMTGHVNSGANGRNRGLLKLDRRGRFQAEGEVAWARRSTLQLLIRIEAEMERRYTRWRSIARDDLLKARYAYHLIGDSPPSYGVRLDYSSGDQTRTEVAHPLNPPVSAGASRKPQRRI
jgi:hypothetical protein